MGETLNALFGEELAGGGDELIADRFAAWDEPSDQSGPGDAPVPAGARSRSTTTPHVATFEPRFTKSPKPPGVRKIAFTSYRTGHSEIWVMNPDGSRPTQLTFSDQESNPFNGDAAWSSDGTRMAFRRSRTGDSEIWVRNADGTDPTNLTRGAGGADPAWSPDGTRMAFRSSRTGDSEIWVVNADGSNPTQLTFSETLNAHRAWSADGTRIALRSTRANIPEIWAWTRTAPRIAFAGVGGVWLMNADGTNAPNLSRGTRTAHPPGRPTAGGSRLKAATPAAIPRFGRWTPTGATPPS